MQLNEQEKDQLLSIINALIGEDLAITNARVRFNESSAVVVEEMIEINLTCNESIKSLVDDLLSGGRALATGWLRRSLGRASRAVRNSKLKGYGCLVSTKSRWKTAILLSAI